MKAQHHDVMFRAGGDHRIQRVGADERGVAVQHDRVAAKAVQRGAGLGHSMGGAQLFGLLHAGDAVVKGLRRACHLIAAMSGDDNGAVRV